MTSHRQVLELHDLDLLLELGYDEGCRQPLEQAGFRFAGYPLLERERARLLAGLEPRWVGPYERAMARYGRGLTLVRDRVCQGCFMTLPTSAVPPPGEDGLHLCTNCGRLLYWR